MLGRCVDLSVVGEPSKNIYLYTLDVYTLCVYIQYMNTDNLTTAEINLVKNLLVSMSDQDIIADQTAMTYDEMWDAVNQKLIALGYVKTSFRLTARQNYTALALNGKQNREFQEELRNEMRATNLMQKTFGEDMCNVREFRYVGEGLLPVEKNTKRSFIKVVSQLVERGLLVEEYSTVKIARGEGIAEALIQIRNR